MECQLHRCMPARAPPKPLEDAPAIAVTARQALISVNESQHHLHVLEDAMWLKYSSAKKGHWHARRRLLLLGCEREQNVLPAAHLVKATQQTSTSEPQVSQLVGLLGQKFRAFHDGQT